MLEVQGMLLGELAAKENRLRELTETPSHLIADFVERVKEVEEVIRSMHY